LEALMDGTALIAAVIGAVVCVAVAKVVVNRQWWNASGMLALGGVFLMNIVTGGNHSRSEHSVIFAASMILLGYWAIVVVASARARRRARG
jgi:hypothetical protein